MTKEKWEDFQVNDADRAYCVKAWGLLYLADVFKSEVIQHYTTPGARRVKDKHITLQRWIQRASPNGQMYAPRWWERMCEQARRYKAPSSSNSISFDNRRRGVSNAPQTNGGPANSSSTFVPAKPETHNTHMTHIRALLAKP